jgi:glutamate/tyrosine decarboxylase-like PLP-dependent enzyme
MTDLLMNAAERGARYVAGLAGRPVAPTPAMLARLGELDHPLPQAPTDPAEVVRLLDEIGSPATVATAGPRYFGFVIGGSLPGALAAHWLAGAWDQNAGMLVASPIGAKLEEVATGWLRDLLGLPAVTEAGFVTGATMANFCGLAAARHALLARQGWDVEVRGLFDAPPLTVIVGDEVHTSVLKALSLLGLGRERVIRVPADGQGRLQADELPPLGPSTVVCLQAGNVNTGAFDPLAEV